MSATVIVEERETDPPGVGGASPSGHTMEGEFEVPAITAEEAEAFARQCSVEGIFRGLGGCGPFGNRLPGIIANVRPDPGLVNPVSIQRSTTPR